MFLELFFWCDMNDEYFIEQSRRVRGLADKADPFTKKRLLALAESYDSRLGRPSRATRQLPPVAIPNLHSDDHNGGGETD
jgi:hypothetical protein